MKNKIGQLEDSIDQLIKYGNIEPDRAVELKKNFRDLYHAIDVKNIKKVRKAVDKLAKSLLFYHP